MKNPWRSASLVAALAACSSPAGQARDAGTDAGEWVSPPLEWAACGVGECATLEVPIDYARPDGPRARLPVMRVPATGQRLGVLVINPGGPGTSATDFLAMVAGGGVLPPEARESFDQVALEWRGTGGSTPAIEGTSAETADAIRHVDARSSAVAATFEAFAAEVAEANDAELMAAVGAEDAARDLESLRVALGEDRLDFIGLSYGTWLGAVYASKYPSRVRAFVLDSVFPPGDVREIAALEGAGYDAALLRFFDWCADTTCAFAAGTPESVAATYDGLVASIRAAPIPAGARTLDSADAATAIARLLSSRRWSELSSGLEAAGNGDGAMLLDVADDAWEWDGATSSSTRRARANAILFVDHPLPEGFDAEAWDDFVDTEIQPVGPRLGRETVLFFAAAPTWAVRPAGGAAIHAPNAPPLLIVQGLHDPATPLAGATAMRAALDNGTYLVKYEGDGHGAMFLSSCIRDAVGAFLLDPTAAPAATTCPDAGD